MNNNSPDNRSKFIKRLTFGKVSCIPDGWSFYSTFTSLNVWTIALFLDSLPCLFPPSSLLSPLSSLLPPPSSLLPPPSVLPPPSPLLYSSLLCPPFSQSFLFLSLFHFTSLVPHFQSFFLLQLPQCLCIHIQRTYWHSNGIPYKNDTFIRFPEFLNLGPFMYEPMIPSPKKKRIYASINNVHINANGFHLSTLGSEPSLNLAELPPASSRQQNPTSERLVK